MVKIANQFVGKIAAIVNGATPHLSQNGAEISATAVYCSETTIGLTPAPGVKKDPTIGVICRANLPFATIRYF